MTLPEVPLLAPPLPALPPSTQSAAALPYEVTSRLAGMCSGPLLLVTEEGEVEEVPEATVLLAAMTGVVEGDGDDLMCDSGMVGGGGGSS